MARARHVDDLDSLLRERETIGSRLRSLIDSVTEPWGIEVTMVEIKDVALPEQMKRVMAREVESERERRAKKIRAQGELEAAESLASAARAMELHPIALQLRTLSTISEIAAERNSTITFPLPFERALEHLAGPATPVGHEPPTDDPPAATHAQ